MSIQMTQDEFKKLVTAAPGYELREEAQKKGGEVTVNLALGYPLRLRFFHWVLLGWLVLATITGGLLSLPFALVLIITSLEIMRTRALLRELVDGLNAAGLIQTPPTAPTPSSGPLSGESGGS